jgi:hypothetical protein
LNRNEKKLTLATENAFFFCISLSRNKNHKKKKNSQIFRWQICIKLVFGISHRVDQVVQVIDSSRDVFYIIEQGSYAGIGSNCLRCRVQAQASRNVRFLIYLLLRNQTRK